MFIPFKKIKDILTNTQTYTRPEAPTVPTYNVPNRGVSFTEKDLNVLRPTLYGEISNRPIEKQELEARVIANTAFNRIPEYNKYGQKKTLTDVLSEPNQYQAYGGKQYKNYASSTNDLDVEKKKNIDLIVNKFIEEMKAGTFADNTQGAFYYQHTPEGKIYYDSSRPLFKTNLGKP